MTTAGGASRTQPATGRARLARRVVVTLGGRYSSELGIDVDAGDAEVERWFLAATLFGTRITAEIAERTFRVLTSAGLIRIGQARHIPQATFIGYLDEGGYAHYDWRTVMRLQALAEVIGERYDGRVCLIGQRHTTYPALRTALDVLPGWGPVTIQLFLRELRGVWPGAQPPLDSRAASAARHLSLTGAVFPDLPGLARVAAEAHMDPATSKAGWSGWLWPTTAGARGHALAGTGAPCSPGDVPASN